MSLDYFKDKCFPETKPVLQAMIGLSANSVVSTEDTLEFKFGETTVSFYHEQDCCEHVYIDDINGDLGVLVGTPLLVAEERECDDFGPVSNWDESYTWTFYTFRSIKGSVDVKWYGSSNGYYSESVDVSVF